jgi:SulP family sulfate permease
MAGILFLVAWGLIDTHHIRLLPRISRQETVVLWVTLIGTLIDLEKGIFFGVALSLALYLYRTSRPTLEPVIPDRDPESYHYVSADGHPGCSQIMMVRLNGSIFFGAVSHLQQKLREMEEAMPAHKHLIVMASGINFVDLAGAEFLAETARHYRSLGGRLIFYRMKERVAETLRNGGFMQDIGEQNLYPAGSRPADDLIPHLDKTICEKCRHRLFRSCEAAKRIENGQDGLFQQPVGTRFHPYPSRTLS